MSAVAFSLSRDVILDRGTWAMERRERTRAAESVREDMADNNRFRPGQVPEAGRTGERCMHSVVVVVGLHCRSIATGPASHVM